MSVTAADVLAVAKAVGILHLLGKSRGRPVTVDYVPVQLAIVTPRPADAVGPPTPPPPLVETLVYHLEDAEFGGRTFVAVTCQGHIVVNPFPWENYEVLSTLHIG